MAVLDASGHAQPVCRFNQEGTGLLDVDADVRLWRRKLAGVLQRDGLPRHAGSDHGLPQSFHHGKLHVLFLYHH